MIATQVFDTGRGSMAAVTARIVDGVMIYSKRITRNPSKTLPQIFQRDKQSFCRTVADSMKISIVDDFWPKVRPLVSGYSNFIGKNLDAQTKFVAPETPFVPDKEKIIISVGSLEGVSFIGTNNYKTADGTGNFAYSGDDLSSGEAADFFVGVVYDISTLFAYVITGHTRDEAGFTIDIAPGLTLANLVFLGFFWREELGKQIRSATSSVIPTAG